jgi:hypothetical protein
LQKKNVSIQQKMSPHQTFAVGTGKTNSTQVLVADEPHELTATAGALPSNREQAVVPEKWFR